MDNNSLKTGVSTLQNGKYIITRVLGQGGFGITYEAEQVSLGRKVAVKKFFRNYWTIVYGIGLFRTVSMAIRLQVKKQVIQISLYSFLLQAIKIMGCW